MKELNKILSGKIVVNLHDELIIINQPDAELRYLADSFAEQIYKEAFEDNLFLQEELETLILENGWWTEEEEGLLKSIPKTIEQMKIEYFNNFLKTSVIDKLKGSIKREEDKLESVQYKKYEFFNYSCESLKAQAYTMHILKESSFYESGEKICLEKTGLYTLYTRYNLEIIGDSELREISKSSEWKMIWNSTKSGCPLFSFPACDLTDMQKSLINWARVYDNIYESPEMPSNDVIDDDYAIDGWFAVQRNKREDDQKESSKDSMPQTGEVFLMSKSPEETKNIHNMNTQEGKGIIKSREKDLKQKGSLKEQDFSHVQNNLKMQATQMLVEHHKKKG